MFNIVGALRAPQEGARTGEKALRPTYGAPTTFAPTYAPTYGYPGAYPGTQSGSHFAHWTAVGGTPAVDGAPLRQQFGHRGLSSILDTSP